MRVHVILWLGNRLYSLLPDLELPEITHWEQIYRNLNDGWFPCIPELAEYQLTAADLHFKIGGISVENNSCMLHLVVNQPNPYILPKTKPPLTDDQCAVLDLLTRWLTDQQIALRLNRSERWVQYRVKEIKDFFEVDDREGLVQYWNEIREILIRRKIGTFKHTLK